MTFLRIVICPSSHMPIKYNSPPGVGHAEPPESSRMDRGVCRPVRRVDLRGGARVAQSTGQSSGWHGGVDLPDRGTMWTARHAGAGSLVGSSIRLDPGGLDHLGPFLEIG